MTSRVFSFATAVVLLAVVPLTAAPPASGKGGDLAQYYGFGQVEILKLQWGIGTPIICDLNKDGRNDLVVTNNRKARIELLLQGETRGGPATRPEPAPVGQAGDDVDVNDRFGKESAWRFKRVSYPLDVEANVLAVGDLNNDGWPDLVFYSKGRGLYVVLQDPPAKGDVAPAAGKVREPKWKPPVKIEITDGQVNDGALAIGDLNGDGRADIALLCGDGVSVVLQTEAGAMARPVKYYAGSPRLRQVNITDLDGDKRADLVLLSADPEYPVCVRFQSSAGQLGPEVRYELPIPVALTPCQLPGQGRSCLFSVAAQSGRVRMSALSPDAKKASYPVYSYPLPAGEGVENRDAVAADVDGDGLLDVVVSDPAQAEFLLLQANAKTLLGSPRRFPGLMDMRKLCAGRLGPGDKGGDAIVAMSIKEKIIGISRYVDGRLTFPETVAIEGEPVAMDLCDLDSDGRLDLVYVSKESKGEKYTLRTVMGLGGGPGKGPTPGASLELTELKDKPLDIRCGDIDHDGRPDVLVIRPYEPVLLVRQAEAGKLEQVVRRDVQSGLLANVFPNNLAIAPLGPKETPAVLLAQKTFARALVFDKDKGWRVVDQYESADPRANLAAAAACRLSPKSASQTIVTYDAARGRVGILTEQADRTYRTTDEIEVGSLSPKKIIAGPFGGETATSILLCGAQKLILMPVAARTDVLREVASFEPEDEKARYGELAVGDVNHDGLPEVVLADQGRSTIEILALDAEGRLATAMRFKVFEQPREVERPRYREGDSGGGGEPRAVLLGDVTGDGKPDLVLLVHDRILIYPQE